MSVQESHQEVKGLELILLNRKNGSSPNKALSFNKMFHCTIYREEPISKKKKSSINKGLKSCLRIYLTTQLSVAYKYCIAKISAGLSKHRSKVMSIKQGNSAIVDALTVTSQYERILFNTIFAI